MEELLKALKENEELSAKLKKLWQEKASAADIAALLKEEGYDVDISVVEKVLEKAQKELAGKVAMEKLDDEALAAVSGGDLYSTNFADCDNYNSIRCVFSINCDGSVKVECDEIIDR